MAKQYLLDIIEVETVNSSGQKVRRTMHREVYAKRALITKYLKENSRRWMDYGRTKFEIRVFELEHIEDIDITTVIQVKEKKNGT